VSPSLQGGQEIMEALSRCFLTPIGGLLSPETTAGGPGVALAALS
jgi:hypothetical protein